MIGYLKKIATTVVQLCLAFTLIYVGTGKLRESKRATTSKEAISDPVFKSRANSRAPASLPQTRSVNQFKTYSKAVEAKNMDSISKKLKTTKALVKLPFPTVEVSKANHQYKMIKMFYGGVDGIPLKFIDDVLSDQISPIKKANFLNRAIRNLLNEYPEPYAEIEMVLEKVEKVTSDQLEQGMYVYSILTGIPGRIYNVNDEDDAFEDYRRELWHWADKKYDPNIVFPLLYNHNLKDLRIEQKKRQKEIAEGWEQ